MFWKGTGNPHHLLQYFGRSPSSFYPISWKCSCCIQSAGTKRGNDCRRHPRLWTAAANAGSRTPRYASSFVASHRQYKQFSDAIARAQDALKMSTELHGADAEQTLAISEACARDHYMNSNKDACLIELEELYPRCSKALGPRHPMTVRIYENLSRLRATK